MAWYLQHTCGVVVHITTIWRTLKRRGWSRTYVRRRAAKRCLFTKAIFRGRMLAFNHAQLVFLDESGADERSGWRSYGWSEVGTEATVVGSMRRAPRWSILPAYTLKGYLEGVLIEQITINAEVLLRWLQESVLPQLQAGWHIIVMDNASRGTRGRLLSLLLGSLRRLRRSDSCGYLASTLLGLFGSEFRLARVCRRGCFVIAGVAGVAWSLAEGIRGLVERLAGVGEEGKLSSPPVSKDASAGSGRVADGSS